MDFKATFEMEQSSSFTNPNKPTVRVDLVIDSTGSMSNIPIKSAFKGVKLISETLQEKAGMLNVKVWKFNNEQVNKKREKIPAKVLVNQEASIIDWGDLKSKLIQCRGQTNLYDAIVYSIGCMERGKHVKGQYRICVVVTDGYDNRSLKDTIITAREKIQNPGPVSYGKKFYFMLFGAGSDVKEDELRFLCKDIKHAQYHHIRDAGMIGEVIHDEVSKVVETIVVKFQIVKTRLGHPNKLKRLPGPKPKPKPKSKQTRSTARSGGKPKLPVQTHRPPAAAQNARFCADCGNPRRRDGRFCESCGAKF